MPGARIELMPAAGHFPHEEFPDHFVRILTDFVRTTAPSVHDQNLWRSLLRQGRDAGPASNSAAAAAAAATSTVAAESALPRQRRPVRVVRTAARA